MNVKTLDGTLALVVLLGLLSWALFAQGQSRPAPATRGIDLPGPRTSGGMSLAEAIATRRSVRRFTGEPLRREQLAQLCWAAQGVTDPRGRGRAAPSAGATYPLRLLVAAPDGLYAYRPDGHALEILSTKDLRSGLARVSMEQSWMASAGAIFVICGDVGITAARYAGRAERYVLQETGHAAQNLLLQATALSLGATPVGAYDDASVARLLELPDGCQPMYLVPVGVPAGPGR